MEQQSIRKTFKYKLKPTRAQEQALETVLYRCRTLYNTALEQRRTWWERGQGKRATCYQQQAELPDLKVAFPKFADVNAQSCRMCCCAWTGHFRRSSVGCRRARRPAIPASMAGSAITASPTSR